MGASRNSGRGGIEETLEGAMKWEAGGVSKDQRIHRKIIWGKAERPRRKGCCQLRGRSH